jgi:hypothetical protein
MPLDSPYPSLPLAEVQRLRLSYEKHLASGGKPEGFAAERMRPTPGLDFALIGTTPKRITKSTYYRCAFCQENQKFSAGKVLIGPDCWKEHFDNEQY